MSDSPGPLPVRRIPRWLWVVAVCLICAIAVGALETVERTREAAARSKCNLGSVYFALHAYQDAHGHLPPAAVCGPDSKPLLSWRVLILPYIEQDDLYKQFKLNEPWDSEHNIRLLDRMPTLYAAPWTKVVPVPPHHTVLHVFVGKGTAFEPGARIRIAEDFPDGSSDTILFVEASDPVPWTKPEEIVFDADHPLQLRGLFKTGFRACAADASYRFVRYDVSELSLRAVITRNGRESGLPPPW